MAITEVERREREARERLAAQTHALVPLTAAESARFVDRFTFRTFKRRQFLVQAGDPVRHEFFLAQGCARAFHTDAEGREHIIQFGVEDWWITDWQAYFGGTEARLNVECLEPCTTLMLTLDDREALCSEMHSIERAFRLKLTAAFVAQQRRLLNNLSGDAEQRYRRFAQEQAGLVHRIPKQHLAAYLGLSRETLSRIRL